MSLPRIVLALAVLIATLLAWLAPRAAAPDATIPAREILTLEQKLSGANYTFDHATSEALGTTRVPRPPDDAGTEVLVSSLRAAGFELRSLPTAGKKVFVVERSGS